MSDEKDYSNPFGDDTDPYSKWDKVPDEVAGTLKHLHDLNEEAKRNYTNKGRIFSPDSVLPDVPEKIRGFDNQNFTKEMRNGKYGFDNRVPGPELNDSSIDLAGGPTGWGPGTWDGTDKTRPHKTDQMNAHSANFGWDHYTDAVDDPHPYREAPKAPGNGIDGAGGGAGPGGFGKPNGSVSGSSANRGTQHYSDARDDPHGEGPGSKKSNGPAEKNRDRQLPIVLDLSGNGISLTEQQNSNQYFDVTGNGYQHRTAWAGVGNGVLAIDADGDGLITERREIVFTDWDPSAKDDMAALRSVFDTNNDGKLDATDAAFAKFRVVVTNADGTTSVKTLSELGIQSINLTTDATKIILPDGSSIDGMGSFTRTDGSTGKAAAVTLAAEAQGYAVGNTTVVNPDGSTTITNVARNADGSVASTTVTNTSADGLNRTITFDNDGDGVVDRVQSIVQVKNGDGSRTETVTTRNGGHVLLDRIQTTTSADGNTIEIARDRRGGGTFDETETRVLSAGRLTVTLSELNPDGTLISGKTVTTSADGLTRTEAHDRDGNGRTTGKGSVTRDYQRYLGLAWSGRRYAACSFPERKMRLTSSFVLRDLPAH